MPSSKLRLSRSFFSCSSLCLSSTDFRYKYSRRRRACLRNIFIGYVTTVDINVFPSFVTMFVFRSFPRKIFALLVSIANRSTFSLFPLDTENAYECSTLNASHVLCVLISILCVATKRQRIICHPSPVIRSSLSVRCFLYGSFTSDNFFFISFCLNRATGAKLSPKNVNSGLHQQTNVGFKCRATSTSI